MAPQIGGCRRSPTFHPSGVVQKLARSGHTKPANVTAEAKLLKHGAIEQHAPTAREFLCGDSSDSSWMPTRKNQAYTADWQETWDSNLAEDGHFFANRKCRLVSNVICVSGTCEHCHLLSGRVLCEGCVVDCVCRLLLCLLSAARRLCASSVLPEGGARPRKS